MTSLSEDEQLLKDAVARFSKEQIAPHVRRMDEQASMDPSIIKGCFENGMDNHKGIIEIFFIKIHFIGSKQNSDKNIA